MSAKQPVPGLDQANDGCWLEQVYKKYIEPLHCLNFSIHDDQTQNLLWRLENGELDRGYISPKVIVLMIGTHNINHSAEEVVDGISEIIQTVSKKQPQATIIVMGLLPCGRGTNKRRTKHESINELLSTQLTGRSRVTYLKPDWSIFFQPDGSTISHREMYDYLHPTESGYVKLAEPLIEELQNCLQTYLRTDAPPTSLV